MKGKHGVSMQGIEYAPKKKGNVLCRNCKHLIFKTTGNKKTKDVKCNHYCIKKKRPTWYTAQCGCQHYEPKEETKTDPTIAHLLQKRAEEVKTARRQEKARKREQKGKQL